MKTRPRLSFWQIWNMSFGFLGIQFGFALQNANLSRIFQTLGADIENIPILWIAAPVTGLIVQPIVGYMSDNTWTRLGRRRPYFLIGAIASSIALILLPTAPLLWIAVGIFWILGASIDMCMEPFRAFVGDMLPPEQRNTGFAMQSFLIGTGSVIASMLPWFLTTLMGVSNEAPEGVVPPSVRIAFLLGGIVFFSAVLWTVLRTREYSPKQLRDYEELEKGAERVAQDHKIGDILPYQKFSKPSVLWIALGAVLTFLVYRYEFISWQLYILTVGFMIFGLIQWIAGFLIKNNKKKNGFVIVINDLFRMPKTMGQLAIVQFFSWVALFSMWNFTTPGVTSHIYNMKLEREQIYQLNEIARQYQDLNASKPEELERIRLVMRDMNAYNRSLEDPGLKQLNIDINVASFFANNRIIHVEKLVPALVDAYVKQGHEGIPGYVREEMDSLAAIIQRGEQIRNVKHQALGFFVENESKYDFNNAFTADQLKLLYDVRRVQREYNQGANWVGVSFSVYNGFAAIIAFLLPWIARRTNRRYTHALALSLGGIGFISMLFVPNPNWIILSMLGIGVAWASILAMPYALLTGSLPSHKMGTYMGLFNVFIVLPQIVAASILGSFIRFVAQGQPIYALLLGGICLFIAALVTIFVVHDPDEKLIKKIIEQ